MPDENSRCYACDKLFCCSDCCAEHIENKHPNRASECPLCRSERLMVKNFSDQKLLCHVVFHHLPLQCRMCGSRFNNCSELKAIGACNRRGFIHEGKLECLLSPKTPSPLEKTPSDLSSCGSSRKEGDYNGNFGNLVSPPELNRKTSTPMHVNVANLKSNFVFKTPRSPNFSLKTPRTGSFAYSKDSRRNDITTSGDKENDSPIENNFKDYESDSCEDSNYQSFSSSSRSNAISDRTPLRSILSNRSAMTSEGSSYLTKSNNSGRKMLDAMQERDENSRIQDNTDSERAIVPTDESLPQSTNDNRDSQHKDSIKRVRFSDQFEVKNEIETGVSTSGINSTESEEFYDARQSISETSMAVVEKLSVSSALINDENEKNIEKERGKESVEGEKSRSSNFVEFKSSSESSSSSRVIMMVVVEKNGTSVNTSELAPLIDSSLKKLVATSAEALAGSVDTRKRENNDSRPESTILSVDSYMSVSTVETYKTPDTTMELPTHLRATTDSCNSGGSSGGIFATVAHAMKMAFRNLSGTGSSKNMSREPIGHNQNVYHPCGNPESNAPSSKTLTNLASALVPRSAKRSRDSDDHSVSTNPENTDLTNEARSPVSKRPRGWYKIRGREPIARMRNNPVTSPRGISSETQRYQQGSLSVGDTILPLPSRAHQSTQTN